MTSISLHSPVGERLGNFFHHLFLMPSRKDVRTGLEQLFLKIDVSEDDNNYFVRADIPGVSKNDIHIEVDGNQVSISAEIRKFKEKTLDKNLVHSERYEGKVYRSFVLGCEVDDAKAVAEFSNGILDLALPKKAGSEKGKRIVVQ